MFHQQNIQTITLVAVLTVTCMMPLSAQGEKSTPGIGTNERVSPSDPLANGLYLVVRSAPDPKELQPLGERQRIVVNDFHFLEPAEREPKIYLVLQTNPFVPLVLGADPYEDKEESTGKPRLRLQLSEDQKEPLASFTQANLGGKIAIVIGGEVVTTHKVKSVISGGSFQITRCTKHGCETLYTSLLKSHR